MKIQTSRHFLARLASRRLARALSLAFVGATSFVFSHAVQAQTTYNYIGGTTGIWSTPTSWNPNGVPGAADTASFTGAAGQTVLLGGNQAAFDLSFTATANTTAVRASAAGNILALGTGGIQYGSTQTDLGGGGANAMVISLMGSQSWTGVGSGLIQFNSGVSATTQSLTNGTAGTVTLTLDGAGTGTKTITGIIDDGVLGGKTAITYASTGTSFGALVLNGNNTYSGGTNFNQGYQLQINSNTAIGTGALNIGGAALASTVFRPISSTAVGGVTLTNNNVQNWNADFSLTGSQNINFGTGAVTLGGNRVIVLSSNSNAVTFTEGGVISGAFSLSTTTLNPGTNGYAPGIASALVLSGANTYSGGTNINFGLVNFPTAAAIPTTGQVVLNGGALAVGPGTAFPTLASVATNPLVTRTSGSLALTADTAENFTAPNGNISIGAALGSVVRFTGALNTNTGNNNYNVGGGGGTIVFPNDFEFTGAKSITTNGGTQFNSSGGGGTVIITGQNDAAGNGGTGVNIGLGTLQVASINSVVNGTFTSNLGSPTAAANGTLNIGASGTFSQLRYTGPGETTDRLLNFAGFSGANFSLDASGTGPLVFSNPVINQASTSSKNVFLRGINTGANTIIAGIGTSGSNNGANALLKQQRGNWTLSGAGNFGSLALTGGTLTADYSTSQVFTTSVPNLTFGGATLAIAGNAAGGTAQTLGTVTLTANTGQDNITVTGNGTAGSAVLTLGTTFTRNANTFLNFNLLNGGQVATATTAVTNGVLVGTGTPLAAFTATNAAGTDFATVTGGQIAKVAAATALPTATGANANNYVLTGSQTQTGTTAINTLRIAPTAGGSTLDLGANNGFTSGLAAVSILKDNANPYTITGTTSLAATAVVLSNFGTGALTVAAPVTTGGNTVTKTGPGLVDLTGANAYTGTTSVYGGVLRLSNATSGTGNITLSTGGIVEIGADLNGATAGDFSRQVGTGGGQVQWANGDGGFSAFGGNRAVSLTNNLGVAGGQLVWGSANGNNFVTAPNASPAFVKDGFALLLGSSTSDSTLDFQNPIDFVNVPRAVVVGRGTAAVDAVLSGVLSSSDFSGGLDKSGAGILSLTNSNTYTGETRILAGTLLVNNTAAGSSGTGTGVVTVVGGILGGTGAISGATFVNPGGTITGAGIGSVGTLTARASLTLTGTAGNLATYAVDIAGNTSDKLTIGGLLDLSGTSDRITFTGSPDGTTTYVLATYGSVSGTFDTAAVPSGYNLRYGNTELDLVPLAVPEPSTISALLIIAAFGFTQRRRLREFAGSSQEA